MTTIKNPLSGMDELPVRWKKDGPLNYDLYIGKHHVATYWKLADGSFMVKAILPGKSTFSVFPFVVESEARQKCMEVANEFLNKLKG